MNDLVAIVLAAGAGSRLGGRAKACLRLPNGQAFLEAIAESARQGGCTEVVVVVAAPHARSVAELAHACKCQVCHNPRPELGMASSIAAAINGLALPSASAFLTHGQPSTAAARASANQFDECAVLIWPVDHPCVRPDTIATVGRLASPTGIVLPMFQGRGGHPTVFGRSILPELLDANLPEGARTVIQRDSRRVLRIEVDDPGVTQDVDTEIDLERLAKE